VYAVKSGVIKSIFMIDSANHIFVNCGDTAIVYGNMDKPVKKVGDTVHVGELIGKIKKAESDNKFELFLLILDGKKEILDESYITFLKRFK
jgi:hypothetical protein